MLSVVAMNSAPSSRPPVNRPRQFATTRWSVVLLAGRRDAPHAHEALADLCRTYWYPLYAHIRRRGHAPHQAQDLTQEFFARLLDKQTLALADPTRGRFRSFILTVLDRFLADERDKTQAQKRGGGAEILSLDLATAERRFEQEPAASTASPDQAFDRRWALALLETVLARLGEEYQQAGKTKLFAALKPTLTSPSDSQPYGEQARQLGLNEGAVKVAVHRLRKRYRTLLQTEIGHTVASPEEGAEELRHLFRTLSAS